MNTMQGATVLVDAALLSATARRRIGNYDLYPREVRDAKKDKAPRPF